jgi:hypothetical protein
MDERLNDLTNEQLIDAVVNYKKYRYSEEIRDDALRVLKARKVPREKLDWLAEKFVAQKREIEFNKQRLISISRRYKLCALIAATGYFPAIAFIPLFSFLAYLIPGIPFAILWFGCAIVAYVFYALAIHQLLVFRAMVEGENDISLLQYILFYGILFTIYPVIIIYNSFYMSRCIRNYGA